ncbi:RNA 2'-phosphotransferase family protein [Umezakia ovalisporum]|jgi:putative RNA 2'-phosphotransferase|uniref:Uncharacterized protein n=1 Tax=Umezakia ovalisporum FSS-62 TaxID=2971776 RepID=A0AA43GVM8_9CYAN|nr:hypothetical protein [Umezakia ovalisporum]MDH6062482.1 hypothetical protein [Umezakia ovalisporum FSS-62]MDH6068515.1 hypothetical protein [Umezakia ovalisporum APH033B]MDH6085162.1 hypothetical protein [Umezakia ovalisporum TAC611]MDH6087375.1 hypothetical protein [Umezakia ovalisporum Ak1311]
MDTLAKVSIWYGHAVIFLANGMAMYQRGFSFYCWQNGVWLVDYAPSQYLNLINLEKLS